MGAVLDSPGREYEEEYRVGRTLACLTPPADVAAATAHLDSLQELEGETGRAAALGVVADGDVNAFDEAMEALIVEYEESYRERREATTRADLVVVAESEVCVEGLALLQLRRWSGLDVAGFTYRLFPTLARQPRQDPYPGDL